jgi:hypothetical protein
LRVCPVREEEEAEALVVVLPAARGERVEDLGAVVTLRAASLVEAEDRPDVELARFRGTPELEERAEEGPAHVPGLLVVCVAEERPELHVERADRSGRRRADGEGSKDGERSSARSQRT